MAESFQSTSKRAKLDAFIELVLAPLPPEEVADTKFNALVRQARQNAWSKAEREVTYHKALYKAILWLPHDKHELEGFICGHALPTRVECLARLNAALINLLLTPASRKADLNWKKRQEIQYLPVDAHVVAKAIADDEAFLASHPPRVEKRTLWR